MNTSVKAFWEVIYFFLNVLLRPGGMQMGKYTLFTANNLRNSSTRLYIFSKLIGKTGVVNYLFRLVEMLRRASNHMF